MRSNDDTNIRFIISQSGTTPKLYLMKINFYNFLFTLLFLVGLSSFSFAQRVPVTIQGTVLNAQTNLPIPNVNVFLSGTTIGSSTDSEGKYVIRNLAPIGKYSLVFSHIQYNTSAKPIIIKVANTFKIDLLLVPNKTVLKEVVVKARGNSVWKKRFKIFKQEFLGTTSLGRRCKILNPWVLNFDKNQDTLTAKAAQELEIINPTLGHKIYCSLIKFNSVNFLTTYLAYNRFELLTPKNERQAQKWKKTRLKTFKGSFRHFASALLYNRLEQEEFKIIYSNNSPIIHKKLKTSFIQAHQLHNNDQIIFDDYLNVVYNKREKLKFLKAMARQGAKINVPGRYQLALAQNSWLHLVDGALRVSDLGIVLDDPLKLQSHGYWAWPRVGNLLPFDYFPKKLEDAIRLSRIGKNKLKQYSLRHPQEKVYLHHDKPYYALGETIWFKSYVVDAQSHRPSTLSGVLYVDLIDQNKKLKKQLKLLKTW